MTAVFMLIFVLLVKFLWPEGTEVLRTALIPGEPNVTQACFSDMMNSIYAGEPLGDAIQIFCRDIIDASQTLH